MTFTWILSECNVVSKLYYFLHGSPRFITSWQTDGGKVETVTDFILFPWGPKSLQMVTAAMKLKDAFSLKEKL